VVEPAGNFNLRTNLPFSFLSFQNQLSFFCCLYVHPGFDGLTNTIIVMDIVSTIIELPEPFSDLLYSIYAINAINIYELAINFDGEIMLRS
jgi:hypothetical protein